jgi:hypothetical protein
MQEWMKHVEQNRNTNRETVAQTLHTAQNVEGLPSRKSLHKHHIPQ